jgi:AhpD family alkylhydroperoxidase
VALLQYADTDRAETQDLIQKITEQRGSVLHLYQMLLHSPPIAEGWLALLTAVRQKTILAAGLRELVIMRVASINGAPYEAQQHAPIALRAGVTQAQLSSLDNWENAAGVYDETQRAVLAVTDHMTLHVQVPRACFDEARKHLDDREIVELVTTVSAYNMVSRFLEALNIHADDPR